MIPCGSIVGFAQDAPLKEVFAGLRLYVFFFFVCVCVCVSC